MECCITRDESQRVLSQPGKPVRSREKLRSFLQACVYEYEEFETSEESEDLLGVLNAAIDGLDCLDGGEVKPIFKPVRTKTQGLFPVSAQRLRMLARFYETLLREQGLSAVSATAEIAEAYKASPDVVQKWKTNEKFSPKNHPSFEFLLGNKKSLEKLGHPPTLKGLRLEIKRLGALYQKANLKKKSGKKTL